MRKRKLLERLTNNPKGATFDDIRTLLLQGCLAQGETQAECLEELNTVQSLWIESARRNRQRIPTPSEALAQLRKLVA